MVFKTMTETTRGWKNLGVYISMPVMDDFRFHSLVCLYADLVSLTLCPLSDLDQFDENENILHRADEQESANTLSVSDHFTRLVWIDPNSPTLQRKGVAEETAQEEDDDEPEDEREQDKEEDARTAHEMDNATEEDGKQTSLPDADSGRHYNSFQI